MPYIRGVRITKSIVCSDSPTRKPLSPVLLVLRGLRMLVRHALAVGVVGKNSQTTASPLPPMQLSEQTLAWLAERPHALHHVRSVWDALTDSAERPDLVATLRAILIDHHFLTRTGRCHACRHTWRRGWTVRRRHFPCKIWYTVE